MDRLDGVFDQEFVISGFNQSTITRSSLFNYSHGSVDGYWTWENITLGMKNLDIIEEALARITGPLGPEISFETRSQDQETWLTQLQEKDFNGLESVLMASSESLLEKGIDGEEARYLAAEGIVGLIDEESDEHLEILQRLISHPESEVAVIDALGDADVEMVVPLLTARVDEYATPAVLVAIAGSLGSVGGADADEVLAMMLRRFAHLQEVKDEVEGSLGMF